MACSTLSQRGVRFVYVLMWLIAVSVAWFMRSDLMQTALRDAQARAPSVFHIDCIDQLSCFGNIAVYRVLAGLCIYHGVLLLATCGGRSRADCGGQFQNSWWLVKLLMYLGIICGCFFIPSDTIRYFEWPAFVGSIFFLLIQLILLVGAALSPSLPPPLLPGWRRSVEVPPVMPCPRFQPPLPPSTASWLVSCCRLVSLNSHGFP